MKFKILALALALSSMLLGCRAAAVATTQNHPDSVFSMELVDDCGSFSVYQDMETGVQYIVYDEWKVLGNRWIFGIVPRYNADGTLYTEE